MVYKSVANGHKTTATNNVKIEHGNQERSTTSADSPNNKKKEMKMKMKKQIMAKSQTDLARANICECIANGRSLLTNIYRFFRTASSDKNYFSLL